MFWQLVCNFKQLFSGMARAKGLLIIPMGFKESSYMHGNYEKNCLVCRDLKCKLCYAHELQNLHF